jgi:hypothetical protein
MCSDTKARGRSTAGLWFVPHMAGASPRTPPCRTNQPWMTDPRPTPRCRALDWVRGWGWSPGVGGCARERHIRRTSRAAPPARSDGAQGAKLFSLTGIVYERIVFFIKYLHFECGHILSMLQQNTCGKVAGMQRRTIPLHGKGAALVEYVVLLAVVGGIATGVVFALGSGVSIGLDGTTQTIDSSITTALEDGPGSPGGGTPGGGGNPSPLVPVLPWTTDPSGRLTWTGVGSPGYVPPPGGGAGGISGPGGAGGGTANAGDGRVVTYCAPPGWTWNAGTDGYNINHPHSAVPPLGWDRSSTQYLWDVSPWFYDPDWTDPTDMWSVLVGREIGPWWSDGWRFGYTVPAGTVHRPGTGCTSL